MTSVGYLAAFLGGVLSLLSPCSALLLPAFFAYAFASRFRLLARTAVFYLGLTGVLVPLGMGFSAATTLVYGHQAALTTAAGVVLIVFGVWQFAGGGFSVPGLGRLRTRLRGPSAVSVLALGAVSGLAGFCAGPILGAVLTVAAASGQPARGAALLAVYAAGMTAPLFALAATWDRLRIGQRRWLRGAGIRVGPLHLHTHSVISGLVFTGLGVLFLRAQGTAGLTQLLAPPSLEGWNNWLQGAVTAAQARIPDLALLAAAAAAVIVIAAWRLRRGRKPHVGVPAAQQPSRAQPTTREPATARAHPGNDPMGGERAGIACRPRSGFCPHVRAQPPGQPGEG